MQEVKEMPTFNQLVRKGRETSVKKSTAPALQKGFNSLKKRPIDASAPQKRGVCTLPEFVFLMVSKLPATSREKDTTFRSTALF